MHIITLITALSLIFSLPALAQVNTEILRSKEDDFGPKHLLYLDLAMQAGNSEWTTVGGKYRYDYRENQFQYFIQLEGEEKRTGSELINQEWFMVGRWSQRWQDGIYGEWFVQKEARETLALTNRQLWGVSLRFSGDVYPLFGIISSDWAYYYGLGLMLETEHYSVEDPNHNQTLLKSTNYISWRIPVVNGMTWLGVNYVQFRLNDWSDYRVLTEQSLAIKLTDNLSFLIDASFRFDAQPPQTIDRFDTKLKSRLRLNF